MEKIKKPLYQALFDRLISAIEGVKSAIMLSYDGNFTA
jgi:hypothetical protein